MFTFKPVQCFNHTNKWNYLKCRMLSPCVSLIKDVKLWNQYENVTFYIISALCYRIIYTEIVHLLILSLGEYRGVKL